MAQIGAAHGLLADEEGARLGQVRPRCRRDLVELGHGLILEISGEHVQHRIVLVGEPHGDASVIGHPCIRLDPSSVNKGGGRPNRRGASTTPRNRGAPSATGAPFGYGLAMRHESSITSLSWIPSEAVPGLNKVIFGTGFTHYDDPPPDRIPTDETFRGLVSCTGPRACYDESKRYGETLCVVFARHYGVPISMARPFNNYGPGLKISDRRVIPDYCRCALRGEPIVMYSDGTPTRTFCYAADAVAGYYKVLLRGRPGEPYNIGTEQPEISMIELARMIAALGGALWGNEVPVIQQPSPESDYLVDNPQRRCPNIGKARRELGYEPGIDLQEGLRRTLAWYHHHPQAEDA